MPAPAEHLGAACPRCNAPEKGGAPRLPKGFRTDFDNKGWGHSRRSDRREPKSAATNFIGMQYLSAYVAETPSISRGSEVSYRSMQQEAAWWPADLGTPAAVGAQNDLHYAVFPNARRLAIKNRSHIEIYDTGNHRIFGVAQAQSADQTLTFTSQDGLVRVRDLPRVAD